MTLPWSVADVAAAFWKDAGFVEPVPRELRRPIARALPVSIVLLPRLRLESVRAWLRDNGILCPCEEADRPLRACLAAFRGLGFIFLDGADTDDEQRFSLAHELGHFLRHYWQPRQEVGQRLGVEAVEVFDGQRPPTLQERLHALLKNVPLDFQFHLMQRGPRRRILTAAVGRAEQEADHVAYELLAPAADVFARTGPVQGDAGRARLTAVLRNVFGLPEEPAEEYARLLLPPVWEEPLLRRLTVGQDSDPD